MRVSRGLIQTSSGRNPKPKIVVQVAATGDGFDLADSQAEATRISEANGHTLGRWTRQVWSLDDYKARCTRCQCFVIIKLHDDEQPTEIFNRISERCRA